MWQMWARDLKWLTYCIPSDIFSPAAMEFPSFAPGGEKNCDYLQLLQSNNFCNVLWSLQPTAGNNYGLNLQMHMIKKKNLGVKTNWHQSPIDGFIVFVLVCDCENLVHLCLLLTFHSTRKFGYLVNVHHGIKQWFCQSHLLVWSTKCLLFHVTEKTGKTVFQHLFCPSVLRKKHEAVSAILKDSSHSL